MEWKPKTDVTTSGKKKKMRQQHGREANKKKVIDFDIVAAVSREMNTKM